MARFEDFMPQGVIPATLAAFDTDYRFDWKETRRHLAFAADVQGVTAVTVNGHASEVHACTLDEQTQMMDEAGDEVGDRTPLICGVYADGSNIAAGIARMADTHGASALLCFPPASMGMGGIQYRPEMGVAHMKMIADATDLPMIVFQYGNDLAYPIDTLVRICEEIPNVKAIKDWSPPQTHDRHIKTLHGLSRPIKVLSTNSAWLMPSLVMGADGLLSGAGSVIADLQVALFQSVQQNNLAAAQSFADRIYHTTQVFYGNPFADMHNRMKEALVLLGRLKGPAVVRAPLMKLTETEIARISEAMSIAAIKRDGAEGIETKMLAAE
ncbi:MAG: 4-hydroxy-tetrahydrodipicolinate synthase [Alphaproteobacteria bacterium MarineAlpha11_Bin1]|nr:MAG: 4-hydroxy-tetrahydrodipicolinate synthase [Alphaproteobacteria bacterium MarineAlpha11_Bin1]|tara:strand:+ start:4121 stop:5098 length:978 start_codon:yes stop_codon:yes gene_type:complete